MTEAFFLRKIFLLLWAKCYCNGSAALIYDGRWSESVWLCWAWPLASCGGKHEGIFPTNEVSHSQWVTWRHWFTGESAYLCNKVTQMEQVICQSCFNRRHMEEKAPTVKILSLPTWVLENHAHLMHLHHQVLTLVSWYSTQCQMFVHKFSISSVIITHINRARRSQPCPQNMVVSLIC